MTHLIATGPSNDAYKFFGNTLPLNVRQWQEFLAACLGFQNLAGAIHFGKTHPVQLDDMLSAAAVILDPQMAIEWLGRKGLHASSNDLKAISNFLNQYWKGKLEHAPVFYWSVSEYFGSIPQGESLDNLSLSFYPEGGRFLVPDDMPWMIGLSSEVVPEWPRGQVLPKVFEAPHGKSSYFRFPLKIHRGDPSALSKLHRDRFPRRTVFGKADVTFYWPRGLTFNFINSPDEPGFDNGPHGFAWANLRFHPDGFEDERIPLSRVITNTVLSGLGPIAIEDSEVEEEEEEEDEDEEFEDELDDLEEEFAVPPGTQCEFCDKPAVVWYDNPYCEDHAEEYADGYIRD